MLHGCKTGEAKITKGYNLPAKHIIHTVGPVWNGGNNNEDALLANCYRSSFALAQQHALRTLAFPAISTGIYHFPKERATRIALNETLQALARYPEIEKVLFVCFDSEMYRLYTEILAQLPE